MMAEKGNVADLRGYRKPPGDDGNGNGGLTRHRLDELERRMGVLEGKVDDLRNTCTRIETNLRNMTSNMASKSYVLWIFGGTTAAGILSIVGHLLIRSFGTG